MPSGGLINYMLLKSKLYITLRLVTLCSLTISLMSCGGPQSTDLPCGEFLGGRWVCDLDPPEDIAWLPDRSGLILSEYGHMGAIEGRLSLYLPAQDQITVLYDSDQPRARLSSNIWGDPDCSEPDYFSPHGIDLSQRGGGRWQLLVVNHGSPIQPEDSIQYFELTQIDDLWFAEWRGCVDAEKNTILNDVTAAPRGFFTTKFSGELSVWSLIWSNLLQRDTGLVLRWSYEQGWQPLVQTAGSFPNGLHWNKDQLELVVNESGRNRVNFYRPDGKFLRSVEIKQPDNIVFDPDGSRYLVTGQDAGFFETIGCMLNHDSPCRMGFSVYSLPVGDPDALRVIHREDGDNFAAGTVTLVDDQRLYIGSFADRRLYIIEQSTAEE